ncbi:DNA polymerase III gamma/tau subunit [Strawberry lethal yellows phytoplasma (CPA) str. NZSb11]|uniref:DNA polymerase III subunit gamma/tau n=1 Tax=Strawberry lethal yellows phytoplasma (CPA) str. NZSb11 TaxID=980422 RepID=R4S0R4_PHYAS|nr:DNA polymerase III gamma/tau subunit [Strawberry lethal yellows phytoplasma (CPA) str. NZSb11]
MVVSYLVLYRKYRPQTFQDVVGQKFIIQTLKNAIRYQKINHCYLFSGNKGTGKTTLAKIFAKVINCIYPQSGDVCNKCTSCLGSLQTNNDIVELDGASYNGVDEIREIQDKAQYKPHIGKNKVYIIDEVHVLTPNAFNALLKILEEPPKHVVFILITTQMHKIPETILSRAQSFSFENLSLENIILQLKKITNLEKIVITDDAIKDIANYSEGSMRNALSLLDQISSYQNNLITSEDIAEIKGVVSGSFLKNLFCCLIERNYNQALKLLNKAVDSGKNLDLLVANLINSLKNYFLEQLKQNEKEQNENLGKKNINNYELELQIDFILQIFLKLQQNLKKSSQKKDLLEIAFIQICYFSPSHQNLSISETEKILKPNATKIEIEKTKVISEKKPDLNNFSKSIQKKEEALIYPKKEQTITNNTSTSNFASNSYFKISSLKNLADIALNILSDKNESQRQKIANAWHKLNTNYNFSSKNIAQLLYKGSMAALSHKKEMILVYQDEIACKQMLKDVNNKIKNKALKILNNKSCLVKDYICFLEKDYKDLVTFLQNNSPDLIEHFLENCNWDLDLYKTREKAEELSFIVQFAYDLFGKDKVEVINE